MKSKAASKVTAKKQAFDVLRQRDGLVSPSQSPQILKVGTPNSSVAPSSFSRKQSYVWLEAQQNSEKNHLLSRRGPLLLWMGRFPLDKVTATHCWEFPQCPQVSVPHWKNPAWESVRGKQVLFKYLIFSSRKDLKCYYFPILTRSRHLNHNLL